MRYTLAELDARGHANNFNLIRLIAAWLVVFSHAFVLLGLPEPGTSQVGMNLGNLAVDIFF